MCGALSPLPATQPACCPRRTAGSARCCRLVTFRASDICFTGCRALSRRSTGRGVLATAALCCLMAWKFMAPARPESKLTRRAAFGGLSAPRSNAEHAGQLVGSDGSRSECDALGLRGLFAHAATRRSWRRSARRAASVALLARRGARPCAARRALAQRRHLWRGRRRRWPRATSLEQV